MKILIAGDWHSDTHEEPLARALASNGHELVRFAWHRYFRPEEPRGISGLVRDVAGRAQNKFLVGPAISNLNRDLVVLAQETQPDAIFVYRGTHVRKGTLLVLHETLPQVTLVGYNNDDPFSPLQPHWAWRHFQIGRAHV